MSTQAFLWLCIGVMTGVAASMVVVRLWKDVATRRWWLVPMIVVPIVAVWVYLQVGSPGASSSTTDTLQTTAVAPGGHTALPSSTDSDAGSMADVTAKLVAKLSAGQGTDADWQLLQQAYAFMGEDAAAALAAQHQLPTAAAKQSAVAVSGVDTLSAANVAAVASAMTDVAAAKTSAVPIRATQDLLVYQTAVQQHPKDAKAWLALAQAQRSARNFTASVQAFEKVIALKGQQILDAGAWADYADAAASVSGSLSNDTSRKALDSALKLQPTHNKALWLKASLLLEDRQYAQSLKVWQQLRAALPAGSPDVSIIEANIAEAQSLAGQSVTSSATSATATTKAVVVKQNTARIAGVAEVAATLKAKVASGMTLFVYAKAADSPMPVAVYRIAVTQWPVNFVLDDSSAMIAGRALSQFDSVIVEARLSRSGQATAQAGDLQSQAVTVNPRAQQNLTLTLSKQVS